MVRKNSAGKKQVSGFSKQKLLNLVSHLENIIRKLKPNKSSATNWNNYYNQTILGDAYLQNKSALFNEYIADIHAGSALDIGANDGYFSRILAERNIETIAIDTEAPCINSLYRHTKSGSYTPVLPLVIDIANPSPASGFGHNEQSSFTSRINVDLVIALALIHHLAIGKNLPLAMIASYFASLAPTLIIEFVPKEDEKLVHMLSTREDIFEDYTTDNFEQQFLSHFEIIKRTVIPGTARVLYLMKRKQNQT
jgi:ribosomal protein L11 methylase PrmA